MPHPLVMTKRERVLRTCSRSVARLRLREILNAGEKRRLSFVSAPAGFGKTTLLGEWLEDRQENGRCIALLSLESPDNGPTRFVIYLATALRIAKEAIGEGVWPRFVLHSHRQSRRR